MDMIWRALFLALLLFPPVLAQNVNTANGFIPGHPYQSSDIDTVDLATGNVMLNIPLRSFKQQDPVSIDYTLSYTGKPYHYGSAISFTGPNPGWMWIDPYIFKASYALDVNDVPAFNGVRLQMNQDFRYTFADSAYSSPDLANCPNCANRVVIVSPDGAKHVALTNAGASYSADPAAYFIINPVSTNPGTLVTTQANPTGVVDRNGVGHAAWFEGQVTSPDGGSAALYSNNGFTNVPKINFDPQDLTPVSITDAKGLTLPWHDPNSGHMGSVLTDTTKCPTGARPTSQAFSVPFPASSGRTSFYIFCYASIPIQTNFPGGASQYSNTMTFLQAVLQPSGTTWLFEYNDRDPSDTSSVNYGSLTKVTLPTGGSITYTYTTPPGCMQERDRTPYSRRVATRKLFDGTYNQTRTYSFTPGVIVSVQGYGDGGDENPVPVNNWSDAVVTVTTPLSTEVHSFLESDGSCVGSEDSVVTTDNITQQVTSVSEGAQSTGFAVVEKDSIGGGNIYVGGEETWAPFAVITTLDDGSVTSRITSQDSVFADPSLLHSFGNLVEECVYDGPVPTGPGICTGSPLEHKTYQYEHSTNSAVANANLLDLPHQQTVLDSSGNVASQVTYVYDLNQNEAQAGNLSSMSQLLLPGNTQLKEQYTYDYNGHRITTQDPNGNTVTTGWDATGVYVTSITRPKTGNTVHQSWTSYDSAIDAPIYQTDENGKSAGDSNHSVTYSYDIMGRATLVKNPPSGGQSSYCYTDMGGSTCTQTSAPPYSAYLTSSATPDPDIVRSQQYDLLARPTTQTMVSDPAGPTATINVYDQYGRVTSVSNPARTTSATTDPPGGMTAYVYDGVGRLRKQLAEDASGVVLATQEYTYTGRQTDYKDEASNHWIRTVDALGRLIVVKEPNPRGGAPLTTGYTYDALGNLTSVHQGGGLQVGVTRYFLYDSLSRLIAACNPETLPSGSSCDGSNNWSTLYSYDLAGNLITKTDARGVTITSTYDPLNRITSKTYSGSNSGAIDIASATASTCFQYDTSRIGQLASEWTLYGPCTVAAPDRGYVTRRDLFYDFAGRSISDTQAVPQAHLAVNVGHGYNAAGNLNLWSNGVGSMNFFNQYDAAGRLQTVTATTTWNDVLHPPTLFDASSLQAYGPYGLQQWTQGTGISATKTYDSRQRLTGEIVTGTH